MRERLPFSGLLSIIALATSIGSCVENKQSYDNSAILLNRVHVVEIESEKLLGYLCHESNMRNVGSQRLMNLEECRQFRNEAYDMAKGVPTPTPLPEVWRLATQTTRSALQTRIAQRGGP